MAANSLHSLTEEELVARFRTNGERRCFAELYRRERRRVYAICLKFLREPRAAEDACHEAFTRAFEHFDRFDGHHFSAWLGRIAANFSSNQLRSMRHETATSAAELEAPQPSLERQLGGQTALAAALDVLRSLAVEQRRAFVMFHIEGQSYREIAARTGLEVHTVRSQLQNARRNFHLRWAKTPFDQEGAAHE